MKFAIIISEQDPAGLNVKEKLLRLYRFKETAVFDKHPVYSLGDVSLYSIEQSSIFAEEIDRKIEADCFIFASKHKAKSENKTFCVHPIGNWGKAEVGGRDGVLVKCIPALMKKALLKLREINNIGYELTMEATHHGPYLEKPTMFIEIGSTEKEWHDKEAALIVAKVIMEVVNENSSIDSVVVIGGTHYNHAANKIMFEKDSAVGHICPKHALEFLDENLLKDALDKSGASLVVLDWKGLGEYKQKLVELCDKLNIKYEKVK